MRSSNVQFFSLIHDISSLDHLYIYKIVDASTLPQNIQGWIFWVAITLNADLAVKEKSTHENMLHHAKSLYEDPLQHAIDKEKKNEF